MAEAVAAKDAEVRAAQDAHTRLLDAEAKRRADVQKAVEEKEMKLARDHAKKLSRLADDHAKALERRDQEHRAERKQDLVKADESAAKYAEALEAKARACVSVESLEANSLRLWKRRMKDVRRRRTRRWRPSRPHSCGRTRPRRRRARTRWPLPGWLDNWPPQKVEPTT